MTSCQLVADLCEENSHLVNSLTGAATSSAVGCKALKRSFRQLLLKVFGFPPRLEFLGIELSVVYNYCYLLSLLKQLGTESYSDTACDIPWKHDAIHGRINLSDIELSLDNVIAKCAERIAMLKKRFKQTCQAVQRSETAPAQQMLHELSSLWFPTELKVTIIGIINIYILHLLQERRLSLAVDLNALLTNFDESSLETIFKAADNETRFLKLPLLSNAHHPHVCRVVKDVMFIVSAVVFYHDADWSSALASLQRCTLLELSDFCRYFQGLLLFKQNNYESSACVLSDLCGFTNLHPQICRSATCLLGDCFSAQGKQHSAIQMYKRCLMQDMSDLVPLHNIAAEYRRLGLVNAEIEALQLLAKLLHDSEASPSLRSNNQDQSFLFDTCQFLKCISREQGVLSEKQAVYELAKRCLETGRHEMAAAKYFELLTSSDACIRDRPNSSSKFNLPCVSVMFEEAIRVQLQAELFSQALTLCEMYLVKLGWTGDWEEPGFEPSNYQCNTISNVRETAALKRSHLDHGPRLIDRSVVRFDSDNTVTAKIALYKTEALLRLSRHLEASAFLESTLNKIENLIIDNETTQGPPTKRPRSEVVSVSCSAKDVSPEKKVWQLLLSDGYSLKARALSVPNNSTNVLHWLRLSAALDIENVEKAYCLVQELLKANRNLEAFSYWLKKRGLDVTAMDCNQIDALIKQRSSCTSMPNASGDETNCENERIGCYVAMDTEALNHLRDTKHEFRRN